MAPRGGYSRKKEEKKMNKFKNLKMVPPGYRRRQPAQRPKIPSTHVDHGGYGTASRVSGLHFLGNRTSCHCDSGIGTAGLDNTTLAVARILGDGRRKRTRVFSELQSHYLFSDRFGRPGKGNDKGKVEGLVGYARRNFMVQGFQAGKRSTSSSKRSASTIVSGACGGTPKRLRNVSSVTAKRCCPCRPRPMTPATNAPRG